jgi:predicted NBD/HSP70 family sugar kinase
LAVSAPVNPAGVFHPPDMEGWENLERPVVEILSETFGVKGLVDNDANLGALAEMRFGEYSDSRNLAYVLIHRGVGAGIVSDGKILRGAANWAGELGHMVIDPDGPRCSCGNFGCLESFVYSRKLVEYTIQEVKFGRPSSLQEKDTEQLHSDDIINAALAGDQAATVAIQKLGDWLGIGLANLISLFNPEVIVLGGALTQAGDILLEPARLIARNRVLPDLRPLVKIEMSSFGQNGPLLGAVASSLDLLLEQEILIPSNSGVINA